MNHISMTLVNVTSSYTRLRRDSRIGVSTHQLINEQFADWLLVFNIMRMLIIYEDILSKLAFFSLISFLEYFTSEQQLILWGNKALALPNIHV